MAYVTFTRKKGPFEVLSQGGIYGIFVDNKPIYIGYTGRAFKERFDEHKKFIADPKESNTLLYKEMTQYERENYSFKILFDVSKAKYCGKINGAFTRHELKCIEYAFIYCFKPKYNDSGKDKPYYFQ